MPQCGSLFALVSIACLVGVIMASNEQFRPFDRSRERLLEHNSDDEQRLPTFDEVLTRSRRPPWDLTRFYAFLQRDGTEDVLDFWLDVRQHESLCKAYLAELQDSGRSIREEWPEYFERAGRRAPPSELTVGLNPQPEPSYITSTNSSSLLPTPPPVQADINMHALEHLPESSLTRAALVASADRIYWTYLAPGSPKEIYIPPSLRLYDPLAHDTTGALLRPLNGTVEARALDIFAKHRDYVFHAMEEDVYPRFLRSHAFGNLVPLSSFIRLPLGVLFLLGGLAAGLSLVLLDVKPKSIRFVLFVPFGMAMTCIVGHMYELDPFLAFLGRTEVRPFKTKRIQDPYVWKLLLGRGIFVTFLSMVSTVTLTLLFWAVPGHRVH